jgi:hypothetical protein
VAHHFDRTALEARIRERERENEELRALNDQLRRLVNALKECEARLVARRRAEQSSRRERASSAIDDRVGNRSVTAQATRRSS